MFSRIHFWVVTAVVLWCALAKSDCPLARFSNAGIERLRELPALSDDLAPLAKWVAEKQGKTVEIELSDGGARVGGIPAEIIDGIGTRSGMMNSGVFGFSKDGPRVIKLFSSSPNKAVPFEDADSADLQTEYEQFGLKLQGAILLEKEGGPKLLGFGRANVHTSKGIRSYFYFETERLFPNEPAMSLKSRLRGGGDAVKVLDQVVANGRTVLQNMATLYLNAVLDGIIPRDGDFMISSSGGVRWIDGDYWKKGDWRSPILRERREVRTGYRSFLNTMYRGGKGKDFEAALEDEVAHRAGITEGDRALLGKVLFTDY